MEQKFELKITHLTDRLNSFTTAFFLDVSQCKAAIENQKITTIKRTTNDKYKTSCGQQNLKLQAYSKYIIKMCAILFEKFLKCKEKKRVAHHIDGFIAHRNFNRSTRAIFTCILYYIYVQSNH